jgi:hypothetical protein
MIVSYRTEPYTVSNELRVTAYDNNGKPAGSTYVKTVEEAEAWFTQQQQIHNPGAASVSTEG